MRSAANDGVLAGTSFGTMLSRCPQEHSQRAYVPRGGSSSGRPANTASPVRNSLQRASCDGSSRAGTKASTEDPSGDPRGPRVHRNGPNFCVLLEDVLLVGPAAVLGDIAVLGPPGSESRPRLSGRREQASREANTVKDHRRRQETEVQDGPYHRVLFLCRSQAGSRWDGPYSRKRQICAETTCFPVPRPITEVVFKKSCNTRLPPRLRQSCSRV